MRTVSVAPGRRRAHPSSRDRRRGRGQRLPRPPRARSGASAPPSAPRFLFLTPHTLPRAGAGCPGPRVLLATAHLARLPASRSHQPRVCPAHRPSLRVRPRGASRRTVGRGDPASVVALVSSPTPVLSLTRSRLRSAAGRPPAPGLPRPGEGSAGLTALVVYCSSPAPRECKFQGAPFCPIENEPRVRISNTARIAG